MSEQYIHYNQTTLNDIWIFEIDGFCAGGIIIADSEEDAYKKLALDRNVSADQIKDVASIYPLNALDLNKSVHDLW